MTPRPPRRDPDYTEGAFEVHGPYIRRIASDDGKIVVLQAGMGGDTPGGWYLVPSTMYDILQADAAVGITFQEAVQARLDES